MRAEHLAQTAPPSEALDAYLQLVSEAARQPDSAQATDALEAGLDALVARVSPPMADLDAPHALAFLLPGGTGIVRGKLEVVWREAGARAGLMRAAIASSELDLAMYDGDAAAARTWRERTGCVRRATIFGPLASYGLAVLSSPLQLETPGAPIPSATAAPAAGQGSAAATTVDADGCELPLTTASSRTGLRAIVVDVDSDHPQRVWLALRSRSAAEVTAGGQPVLSRGFDAGGGQVRREGAFDMPAGRVRLTVRVALREDGDSIVLQLVGDDGLPLHTVAPNAGERAPARARGVPRLAPGPPTSEAALLLRANALLALGDARAAGSLLEPTAARGDAGPAVLLTYARALATDSALPDRRRVERMRDAYDRACAATPVAWESAVGRAWLEGQRMGQSDARVGALAGLPTTNVPPHPMLSIFEAATAARARLRDRALRALEAARESLGDAPAVVSLDGVVRDRGPAERARFRCSTRGLDASSLDCHAALVELGDVAGTDAELRRLRELRGSPDACLDLETASVVRRGDPAAALRLYGRLPPGERFFSPLGLVVASRPQEVMAALSRDLPLAPKDISNALDLHIAASAAALRAWDDRGAKAVAADRANPVMPDAALLVLDHDELYEVSSAGLIYYVVHDVRRLSGTTDVDASEQWVGPTVDGIEAHRVLRRRVHKRDGGIIEPEDSEHAEQRNADLAQLQPGDYVEQLLAGFVLGGPSGRFVVDTPDLMPERASVHNASIMVHSAQGARVDTWAHPLLSRAMDRRLNDGTSTWRWQLTDASARRLESDVPQMDRRVRVTFGNSDWGTVASALADVVQSMQADDPVVSALAQQAAGTLRTPSQQLLQNVVAAVGARVPVASGTALSDTGAAMSTGPQRTTARTILEDGHGSRTWLAREMLRALGVDSEVVAAEDEPFSSDPSFPAHTGRFAHPLLLVHLPAGPGGGDAWLDLDVPGPPLPPGRVSAELQGRSALRTSGQVITVPARAGDEPGDEIHVQLVVDDRGDAKGELTIKLRGRGAQYLAESFQTTVGAARRELLRGVVLAWIPRADVQTVELSSGAGAWEVDVRATVAMPGFAQPEGNHLLLPGLLPLHPIAPEPGSSTLVAEFASEGQRDSALAVDDAVRYELSRSIQLPAGWSASAPSDASVEGERLRGIRRSEVRGPLILESFRLSLSTGTVAVEQLGQFATEARRIDDAFLSGIRVDRGNGRAGQGAP